MAARAKKKTPTKKKAVRKTAATNNEQDKSIESWIWDAACSIRGAKDTPKYKDFILPLIFTKRLCDVFDDELNRIAEEVGTRKKAFQLAKADHKLVRFYLPLMPEYPEEPVWSAIRKIAEVGGQSACDFYTNWTSYRCSNPCAVWWILSPTGFLDFGCNTQA